jgi:hypothetical protein
MEHAELIDRAARTLTGVANASLATVSSDGRPWNSPLFVAFGAALRFYWSSHTDAVHSRNIAARGDICLVVFDSTQPDESGAAVYVRATARELLDTSSIQAGLECLAKRKSERPKAPADFMRPHPRRVYEAVPQMLWTNIVHQRHGHYFDERVVIALDDVEARAGVHPYGMNIG